MKVDVIDPYNNGHNAYQAKVMILYQASRRRLLVI